MDSWQNEFYDRWQTVKTFFISLNTNLNAIMYIYDEPRPKLVSILK